jgi:hypothetical protein
MWRDSVSKIECPARSVCYVNKILLPSRCGVEEAAWSLQRSMNSRYRCRLGHHRPCWRDQLQCNLTATRADCSCSMARHALWQDSFHARESNMHGTITDLHQFTPLTSAPLREPPRQMLAAPPGADCARRRHRWSGGGTCPKISWRMKQGPDAALRLHRLRS